MYCKQDEDDADEVGLAHAVCAGPGVVVVGVRQVLVAGHRGTCMTVLGPLNPSSLASAYLLPAYMYVCFYSFVLAGDGAFPHGWLRVPLLPVVPDPDLVARIEGERLGVVPGEGPLTDIPHSLMAGSLFEACWMSFAGPLLFYVLFS